MSCSTLFLVLGTLFIVSGILCLVRAGFFSRKEEDARANVLERKRVNERLFQNFLRAEALRNVVNTLIAGITAVRELRQQQSNPKQSNPSYDDNEFRAMVGETDRVMNGALQLMAAASESETPTQKDEATHSFHGLMNDLTEKFVEHYNRRVKETKEMEKRVNEYGSKVRFWQYLAHSLNIVGVILIMVKDLVPSGGPLLV